MFNRDGRLLAAGSADDTVRLWSVDRVGALRSLGGPLNGPVGYIYALSFNPDRDELAVGSTDDTIWLWDLGQPDRPVHLATLTGPTEGVLVTALSPNGRTLAASGHDPTVGLWAAKAFEQTARRTEWAYRSPKHDDGPAVRAPRPRRSRCASHAAPLRRGRGTDERWNQAGKHRPRQRNPAHIPARSTWTPALTTSGSARAAPTKATYRQDPVRILLQPL